MSDAVLRDLQQSADTSRRKFLVGVTTMLSAVGAVGIATPFVSAIFIIPIGSSMIYAVHFAR